MDRPPIKSIRLRLDLCGDLCIGEGDALLSWIADLESAIVEWERASATFRHVHSVDMGGKSGYVIRVPQGTKGDVVRNADSKLCTIAEQIKQ